MSYVRQVVTGLPETTMDNEEQWERSLAAGKSQVRKLTMVIAIADPYVERWWVSVQDVAQDSGPPFTGLLTQTCRVRFSLCTFSSMTPGTESMSGRNRVPQT